MPSIIVRIEWDVPEDPNWLNPYNLELVLAEYCTNTAFEVVEVKGYSELREVLEELADLMDDTVSGEYVPDSFTTQPARTLLLTLPGDETNPR